jgi:hypothetical protein
MYLGNSLLSLSLLGECPAPLDGSIRQEVRKPLVGTEGNQRFCPLLSCLPLPTELVDCDSNAQGQSQAKRVRQLVGQGENLANPPKGLVWVAKKPEGLSHPREATHASIIPVEEGMGAMLLGIVESNPLL